MPPDSPLITILIPTYSRADYLPDAIRSALTQTHSNIEIIILDDASPDSGQTAAAVQPFLVDGRVRYIRHPTNLGIAGNWRTGIELAAGEFFCLLHDDDTFEPSFVAELLTALLADAGAVIAFCDHWVTDPMGKRLPEEADRLSHTFRRDALAAGAVKNFARTALIDTAIPIGATLFRRTDVTPEMIDDAARGSIDMWLLYGCVTTGKRAVYVPLRLMNYRTHAGGMSSSKPIYMTEGHLWRYERLLADPRLAAIHDDLLRRRTRTMADYGIHLLAAGRPKEAAMAMLNIPGRKAQLGRLLAKAGTVGTAIVRLARRMR